MTAAQDRYVSLTPSSRRLHEEACRYLPGGTTRTTVYFVPYPLYIRRGRGCRVWDVDGTERLDLIGNYSALILGHGHPAVVRAIAEQLERGTSYAAANEQEVVLARLLCERLPSVERIRFTSSGTEATMFAMRLARVATGRRKLARFEGGYHGTHDFAEVSTKPDLGLAGPPDRPLPVADSPGTPASVLADTVVLPFNDLDAVERILRAEADHVAGVIIEPVLGAGGAIPAEPDFLRGLRSLTRDLGMLLIFDEVISFRLAPGGAQELYGVTPDLTTLAKVIGGGLPAGAFGGRADIMDLLDPRRPGNMPQGGTYNGNPLAMAAGVATLRELVPEAYERLDRHGETLRRGLRDVFDAHRVAAQVTGIGSLLNVHFTSAPVRDHRGVRRGSAEVQREFFLNMVNEGILLAPRGMAALSTPMVEADLRAVLAAADRAVGALTADGARAVVAVSGEA